YLNGPPPAGEAYTLMRVIVTPTRASAFAKIFGQDRLSVRAVAIAAHRPRDVCMVLDYSGSMNNESDLWTCSSYLGANNFNKSNNPDSNFPQFGVYAKFNGADFSPEAKLQYVAGADSTDPAGPPRSRIGRCNVSVDYLGEIPLVNDFFLNDDR